MKRKREPPRTRPGSPDASVIKTHQPCVELSGAELDRYMLESKLLSYGKVRIRVRTPKNCRKNRLKWRRGTHSFLSLSLSLSGAPVLHCQMPLVRASRLSCLTSYGAPYDVRVRFRGGWVDGASPPSECVTHSLTHSLAYVRTLARPHPCRRSSWSCRRTRRTSAASFARRATSRFPSSHWCRPDVPT